MECPVKSLDDAASAVGKSAVIVLSGSLFGRGLALVAEALIAQSLAPELYGTVSLSFALILTLGSVLLFGVNQGLTRLASVTESQRSERSYAQSAYLITTAVGLVGIVAVSTAAPELDRLFAGNIEPYLLLLSPFLVLFPLSRVSIGLLRAWERTTAAIVSRALASRVLGLLLWGTLFLLGYRIEAAVVYWLGVPVIITLVALWFIRGHISLSSLVSTLPERDATARLLSFSWPLAMSSIVFLFLSRLDIMMIGYFLDSAEVGYYRSIQPLQQSTTVVLEALGFVFLPIATRYYENGEIQTLERLFESVTKWGVVLSLPLILGLTLFSGGIVRFLLGDAYLPAALPLSVLVGGLFVRTITGLNGDVTKAIDRPKIELYSAVVGVVSNAALNVVLIPRYGIVGAAVATVCGFAVYNAVELYLIYDQVGVTPFSWNVVKPALFTIAASLCLVALVGVPSGIVYIGGATILIGVVSVLSISVTGSVERVDVRLLEDLEGRLGRDLPVMRRLLRLE